MSDEPSKLSKHLERIREKYGTVDDTDDLFPEEADAMQVRDLAGLARARWAAMVPQRFVRASLDDFATDERVHAMATEWADHEGGRNLVLFGAVGVGKTHLAVAACRPAAERGLTVEFVPAVEMFDRLRPGGPEDALDDLCECDRLIIDDLGVERPTDWTAERLYLVVNRRWLDERPTVVTTNLESKDLAAEVGARMFSRIVGSDAVGIRLNGPDRRRKQP